MSVLQLLLRMSFITGHPDFHFGKPVFCSILANTALSTIPGISGAGPGPAETLLTPVLDSELIVQGSIVSCPVRPDTPTGCPTPASITRAMMQLTGLIPVFVNAGLAHHTTVPCIDLCGTAGRDPRMEDGVPDAARLFSHGKWLGNLLSQWSDLLVVGECVPGGTTSALCVLRALGYPARVSSSYPDNPVRAKERVCEEVLGRISRTGICAPLDILRAAGDPMMPVAAGMCSTYRGTIVLAGGTQMLAVAAVARELGMEVPRLATTCYVREDPSANVDEIAGIIGVKMYTVDPGFGTLGHSGLARYCIGEVKEGMGAGGSMFLANLMGFSPDEIRNAIYSTVSSYA